MVRNVVETKIENVANQSGMDFSARSCAKDTVLLHSCTSVVEHFHGEPVQKIPLQNCASAVEASAEKIWSKMWQLSPMGLSSKTTLKCQTTLGWARHVGKQNVAKKSGMTFQLQETADHCTGRHVSGKVTCGKMPEPDFQQFFLQTQLNLSQDDGSGKPCIILSYYVSPKDWPRNGGFALRTASGWKGIPVKEKR